MRTYPSTNATYSRTPFLSQRQVRNRAIWRRFVLLILLALVGFQAFAQNQQLMVSHRDVKVIDEVTKKLVRGAEFTVFDTHGRQLENVYCSEQLGSYNGKERFFGYNLTISEFVDTLVIRATIPGHEVAEIILPTPREKYEELKTKDGRFWWNDEIRLTTRRRMEFELGEAEVTASRILMVQKGDTIVYNAAALQMSSGSMLNNLVRALPGVQLGAGGRITVNGEYVSSLLVNGKDFFKGDPNVALDNLPYYTVDKIKVYHKGVPDLTNATHLDSLRAEAFPKPLVMDVRLKKEYGEGWLANFEAAAGVRSTGEEGLVHRGRAFALRFTDHSKIGIYASANNVGDNHNPTHNGEWREMNAAGSGENTLQTAGIDFSIENKEQTRTFETTLTARHNDNNTQRITSKQDFYSTGDVFSRSHNISQSNFATIGWDGTFRQSKKKKYSFWLTPHFNYQKTSNSGQYLSADFDGNPHDATRGASLDSIFGHTTSSLESQLITTAQTLNGSESRILNTSLSTGGSIYLPFTKQNLNLGAKVTYIENNSTSLSLHELSNRASGRYNENGYIRSPQNSIIWEANVGHPLFFVNSLKGWADASISYNYYRTTSTDEKGIRKNYEPYASDQQSYVSQFDAYWRDVEGWLWAVDHANSYTTQETSDRHSVTLQGSAHYGKFFVSPSVTANYTFRSMTDTRDGRTQHVSSPAPTFSSHLSMGYRKVNFNYGFYQSLPMMSQLLDVTDNSFSLSMMKGNPDLRSTFNHNLSLSYTRNRQAIGEWFTAKVSADIRQHQIQMGHTYDRTTGMNIYQYFNTEGNWSASGNINWGRALDKKKRFILATNTTYNFYNRVDFSTDAASDTQQRSLILNHNASEQLGLSYNIRQQRVELTARLNWNGVSSDRASFQHLSYTDHYYGLTFATPLFPGIGKDKWTIDLDTDVKLYLRRGYREPLMNTTEWVWNAALSTRVGKTKQWTLRAVGFDLLHQLSNITHYLTAQSFTETWTNTVRSYVSFHVVYHLQMKPKKGIL